MQKGTCSEHPGTPEDPRQARGQAQEIAHIVTHVKCGIAHGILHKATLSAAELINKTLTKQPATGDFHYKHYNFMTIQ